MGKVKESLKDTKNVWNFKYHAEKEKQNFFSFAAPFWESVKNPAFIGMMTCQYRHRHV